MIVPEPGLSHEHPNSEMNFRFASFGKGANGSIVTVQKKRHPSLDVIRSEIIEHERQLHIQQQPPRWLHAKAATPLKIGVYGAID